MSDCEHEGWDIDSVANCDVCNPPSTTAPKRASSQEAYYTVVKIERYRDVYDDEGALLDELCEDSYCFEIGTRTFPEVLELVDGIKEFVTLCMREAKR